MLVNFGKQCKVTRVVNATAAGTTTINSSILDMSGYDGVVFIALFGTLTATQVTSLKVQSGNAANLSDAADVTQPQLVNGSVVNSTTVAGPLGDSQSNFCLISEVLRPQARYVRAVVVRGTANAVIDGVIAIQYRAAKQPVTQDASTVSATALVAF
jgi:hypothetical protein